MRGTCGRGFALNVLFNIFKAITAQNALLQCEIHILAEFNNPQQRRFVTISLVKYILFLINSV